MNCWTQVKQELREEWIAHTFIIQLMHNLDCSSCECFNSEANQWLKLNKSPEGKNPRYWHLHSWLKIKEAWHMDLSEQIGHCALLNLERLDPYWNMRTFHLNAELMCVQLPTPCSTWKSVRFSRGLLTWTPWVICAPAFNRKIWNATHSAVSEVYPLTKSYKRKKQWWKK